MSEKLDPYYKWLGIAPKDQPPNHYRLLGIDAFESNADVICNAADRQMAHLRSVSTGKHASLSQKLLNEISAARVCLLDPDKKETYDSQLRAAQQATESPLVGLASPPAAAPPGVFPSDPPLPPVAVSVDSKSSSSPRRPVTNGRAQLIKVVAGGLGGVIVAGLLLMLMFGGDDGDLGSDSNESTSQPAVAEAVTPSTSTEAEATSNRKPEPSNSESNSKVLASEDLPAAGTRSDGSGAAANTSSPSNDAEKSASVEDREAQPDQASVPDTTSQAEPPSVVAASTPPEVIGADENSGASAPAEETSTSLPAGPNKLAVPGEDVQRETLLQIKDVFKESYGKAKTPAGKAELAKLLYDKAEELKDDPTVRFVMLRDGYNLAIEVKEFRLAFQFVDRLTAEYELDELQLRLHMLTEASVAARLTNDRREIAELALGLVDTAVQAKRFEDAIKLVELAEGLAARARDTDLRAQARSVGKEVKGSQQAWKAVQQSLQALQTSPDDAAANLACGQYFCFVEGDWQRGLPMLIKGSDQALSEAARQDRSNPLGPEDQEQLGDMWWKLGETQEGLAKVGSQVRAAHWYQRALPGLSGLAKSKVEKRLAEVDAPTADHPGPFQKYEGTWIIKYASGQGRRYVVDSQGNVIHDDRQAKLTKQQGQVFLDFGDGKLERVTLDGRVLRIEHFNPAKSFPNKPLLAGGSRMVTVDAALRQPFKDYEGLWIIKYTNKVERRYAIDRAGNVLNAELRSKLVIKNGEVLLDFGDGLLERLEVRGNTLHVEHYNPASRYPGNFKHYAAGIRQRR